jgi:molybdopterin-synthase adenylyltransferase
MATQITELVISSDDIEEIKQALLGENIERCAILFAHEVDRKSRPKRLLVREVEFPSDADYARRGPLEAELSPETVARVTKRARLAGMALVFVHSHPGESSPMFSAVDNWGEARLSEFLSRRHPKLTHAALVISKGGVCARRLGSEMYIRVLELGENRNLLFDPVESKSAVDNEYDRQVRAFGEVGQRSLEGLKVAIVGLGGTGSIIAQELVHLGVREFVLIDPDVVEVTNLNRVANAHHKDIGKTKVSIATEYIKKFSNRVAVSAIVGDITRADTATSLTGVDFIFGCTDSHGSRAVLQQISYQYLVPCIDMGAVIAVTDHEVRHLYGRVQLLSPGLACLTCSGLLNPEEVRRDMMSAFERKQDPYIIGMHEPAPAVMSLNGTVASLAVTMFLSVVAGVPSKARHLLYNGIASSLRSARAMPEKDCYICSRSGAFGRGDSWPIFGRND